MLLIRKFSVTSPASQLIPQPFRRFTYVKAHSPTFPLIHLRHSSFSNPFFASPTSQALHLRHLANRPWYGYFKIESQCALVRSNIVQQHKVGDVRASTSILHILRS